MKKEKRFKKFFQMFSHVAIGLVIVCVVQSASADRAGAKCKQKRCLTTEYCSQFDDQCYPCSKICEGRNQEPDLCSKDCQEYLHDQRYVLRKDVSEDGDKLKNEVQRLQNLVTLSLTLTCISLLGLISLVVWKSLWIKKLRKSVQAGWLRKKWVKKATNNNRVQDDAEAGPTANNKQNGLKSAVPTISATVVAPRSNDVSDGTPNTTSTPLSRRHPSEDATLDYAYDNPAMTPSPEAVPPRTKRESSF